MVWRAANADGDGVDGVDVGDVGDRIREEARAWHSAADVGPRNETVLWHVAFSVPESHSLNTMGY